ncbi:MAG: hypothetical protein KBB14_09500, partial [Thermoanaerobaculia bacterium]|nr:hypothetical protein [Thermoanaerobaculia bacterium]
MTASEQVAHRRRRLVFAFFLVAFVVYNLNGRTISAGDNYPTRFLPFAMWGHGTVSLEPILEATSMDRARPYWIQSSVRGEPVSMYPIVLPVLLAPTYGPVVGWLSLRGWTERRIHDLAELMEKVLASGLTAAGAAALLALLLRRTRERDALLLASGYAFATNTWVTSSQGLWQHTLGQVLLIGILGLCQNDRRGRAFDVLLGLLVGLHAANRPFNVLAVAPFVATRSLRSPRSWPGLGLGLLAGAGPFVAYNVHYFGHPGGFYAVLAKARPVLLEQPLLEGFAGLLVSPSKGLFVFSPFLAFVAVRIWRRRAGPDGANDAAIGAGLLLHLILFSRTDFTAGACYGPRFMVDVIPAVVWLLPPALGSLGRAARTLFLIALAWGAGIQVIGAFRYPMGQSDLRDP